MRRVLLLVAVLAGGCGHRASVAECEQIVERIAELEIQKQPAALSEAEKKSEIESARQSLRQSTLKDCVGRRVTDRAMLCVERAKTSQEIVEDCFD